MSRQSQEALAAVRGTFQVLFVFSLLFTAGAAAAGVYAGVHWFFAICGLLGAVLSLYFGVRLRALGRDTAGNGIASERCYVQSCLKARSEVLFVKTPTGSITLSNATQFTGDQLTRKCVRLEYAKASKIALRAELEDQT